VHQWRIQIEHEVFAEKNTPRTYDVDFLRHPDDPGQLLAVEIKTSVSLVTEVVFDNTGRFNISKRNQHVSNRSIRSL
jgi:hypothetical protein